jgi:protein arginine kinase
MKLDDLLSQTCPWLLGEGEESDIVISSRIRLARNLVGYPFPIRASEQDRRLVQDTVKNAVAELFPKNDCYFTAIQTLSPLDKEYLFERQLISRELVETERTHAAVIDRQERFCVVINEEDHVRIHAASGGFAPQKVWEQVDHIDNQLGSKLDYVFHEKYGFLTTSATNAGTGMRIYMVLHLPALAITHEMDKVGRALQKNNLTVRGLRGSGMQTLGDFYQISNQVTMGKSEEELLNKMFNLIPQIAAYERQARNFLIKDRREIILDRCSRAAGVLRTAQTISELETMKHLSSLRLGIHTGLLDSFSITTVNTLLLHTQPAHLEKMHGVSSPTEQDVVRATYVRQMLDQVENRM